MRKIARNGLLLVNDLLKPAGDSAVVKAVSGMKAPYRHDQREELSGP